MPELTWGGRLNLGLVLFTISRHNVRWWVFSTLNLTFKSIQTLNVLLFQRAGSTAGGPHIQICGQLPPFFVLINLQLQGCQRI